MNKETFAAVHPNIEATPFVDPITNAPHVAGGRFTQVVHIEHALELISDIRAGDCTLAASVYYDSTGADPRSAGGVDIHLCEALMLMQLYGGYVMYDSNFVNQFHLFDNMFFADGHYYQNDQAGVPMDITHAYFQSFYDLLTFTLELLRGMYSSLKRWYVQYFVAFKFKMFRVIGTNINGSTNQILSFLRATRRQGEQIVENPFFNGRSTPAITGSQAAANLIVRNDVGLLIAPAISVERTCATAVSLPETKTVLAQYVSTRPYSDMASQWQSLPQTLT